MVTMTSADTFGCGEFAFGDVEGTAVVERIRTVLVGVKVDVEDTVEAEGMAEVDREVDAWSTAEQGAIS